MIWKSIGLAACLSILQISSAEPLQRELDFSTMRDFSRCSAMLTHFSNMAELSGKPANAKNILGYARGAEFAASFIALDMAMNDNKSEDEQAAQRRSNFKSIQSIKELEINRQMAFFERGETDMELMQFCLDLNPLQAQIVESARESGFFEKLEKFNETAQ